MALTNVESVSEETKARIVGEPHGLSTQEYLLKASTLCSRRTAPVVVTTVEDSSTVSLLHISRFTSLSFFFRSALFLLLLYILLKRHMHLLLGMFCGDTSFTLAQSVGGRHAIFGQSNLKLRGSHVSAFSKI
jgi:hypothetical protein